MRQPVGSSHDAAERALDELARDTTRVSTRSRRKPKPPERSHAWWPKDVNLPPEDAHWLRDTPLESIQALLCDPSTKLGFDYSERAGGKLTLEELPSSTVLRQAILALRLSMTDSAKLAEYYRLKGEREKLTERINRLGAELPRELGR